MQFLFCVLGDIVHLIKIFVICNIFFVFSRRRYMRDKFAIVSIGIIMCISIALNYLWNDEMLTIGIQVVLTVLMLAIFYSEKLSRIVITTIWLLVALFMLDNLTAILYDVLTQLIKVNGKLLADVMPEVIALGVVGVTGFLYRKTTVAVPKTIEIADLIGFMILLEIDNVVVTMISIMYAELCLEKSGDIYLLPIFLVILGMFVQLAAVILIYAQKNLYKEKEMIADKFLNEQIGHYEYLENREKETKKFRHDLRSHMETISNLANNHEYERMTSYLEQMNMRIDSFGNMVTVHNGIVDAIINQYYTKATQDGIKMSVRGRIPSDCKIAAFDLCTIFSNMLSNAYEAAIKTDEKYISMECRHNSKSIIVVVKNSFNGTVKNDSALWTTTKVDKEYHGYGLENIKDSVEKYNGIFDIETNEGNFTLTILFHYNL